MADSNPEKDNTSALPTRRQPARRPGRNRKTTPLATSFKQYVDNAPEDEVKDLGIQLQAALGSIANGPGGGDVSASCGGRMEHHNENTVNCGVVVNDGSPQQQESRRTPSRRGRTSSIGSAGDATGSSRSPPGSLNASCTSLGGSSNPNNKRRPSSSDEYYIPKSSSRRNSKAGEELAMSMKMSAQRMLAELGEISDDDDDDDGNLGGNLDVDITTIRLGALDGLREESMRGIMREDSKYSPHA